MKIVRHAQRQNYAVLPNAALTDQRLSYRARGILAYILSRPDDWQTSAARLAQQGTEGREAIRTALKELEAAGYLVRTRCQDAGGRWRTEATIYDEPITAPPETGFRASVSRASLVSTDPSTESPSGGPAGSEQAPTATRHTVRNAVTRFVVEWEKQVGRPPSQHLKGMFAGWAKTVNDPQWLIDAMPAIVAQHGHTGWADDVEFNTVDDLGWSGITDHLGREPRPQTLPDPWAA